MIGSAGSMIRKKKEYRKIARQNDCLQGSNSLGVFDCGEKIFLMIGGNLCWI